MVRLAQLLSFLLLVGAVAAGADFPFGYEAPRRGSPNLRFYYNVTEDVLFLPFAGRSDLVATQGVWNKIPIFKDKKMTRRFGTFTGICTWTDPSVEGPVVCEMTFGFDGHPESFLFLQAHVLSDSPGQTNTLVPAGITGGTGAFFGASGEAIATRPFPSDIFSAKLYFA